jgi:hypothetical protein
MMGLQRGRRGLAFAAKRKRPGEARPLDYGPRYFRFLREAFFFVAFFFLAFFAMSCLLSMHRCSSMWPGPLAGRVRMPRIRSSWWGLH